MDEIFESILKRIRALETMEPGPPIYVQSTDPGAVGAGSLWIDTSTNKVYIRDTTDSTWILVGSFFNPMTAVGDMIVGIAAGAPDNLAIGSAGEVLTVVAGSPSWEPIPSIDHNILSTTHDDTTVSVPNDLDVLTWDAGSGTWVAAPAVATHDILSATHDDTTVSAPNNNDVLTWSAGSSTWIAQALPSGTDVATDPIWDAKGDLAVGTGANTAIRVAVGTDGKVLYADSGTASGVKWDTLPASAPHDILSASHSDTNTSAPSNNDVLTWDSGAGEWKAAAISVTTIATDPIWDSVGDLVVGTGANTAAKLPIGTAGEVLTVVAGTPSWEPAAGGGVDTYLALYNLLGWA